MPRRPRSPRTVPRPRRARDAPDDGGKPKSRLGPYPGGGRHPRPAGGGRDGWEVAVCGELTDKQHDLVGDLIALPRGSRGTLWFDSCGGSIYVGLALAAVIRLRGLRATAVVAGECSSAAIVPFAACERRFVTRHSALLFHPVRWSSEEDVKMEEAAEWARHFQWMEEDADALLSKLFPFPAEKLKAWTRPGKFVTGEELVKEGLAELITLFDGDVWGQMNSQAPPA